jgi:hypothetical protein
MECSKQYGRSVNVRAEIPQQILPDDICHLKLMALASAAAFRVSRYWRPWQIAIDNQQGQRGTQ